MNFKNITIFLTIMLLASLCPTAIATDEINVALNKPIIAVEDGSTPADSADAANINDGDKDTYWHGVKGAGPSVTIDLGVECKINRIAVTVRVPDTEKHLRSNFYIYGSLDNVTYTELAYRPALTNEDVGDPLIDVPVWTKEITNISIFRYIRIKAGSGNSYLLIKELEVFAIPENIYAPPINLISNKPVKSTIGTIGTSYPASNLTDNNSSTYTELTSTTTGNITFDLESYCQIDKIEIGCRNWNDNNPGERSNFYIEGSADNENFYELAFRPQLSAEDATNDAIDSTSWFAEVDNNSLFRYIRIRKTVEIGNPVYLYLNELKVWGNPDNVTPIGSFNIVNCEFTDSENANGNKIEKFIAGDVLGARVTTVNNDIQSTKTMSFILALYSKDNILVDVKLLSKTLEPLEAFTFKTGLDIPKESENLYARAFVWESASSAHPLFEPLHISQATK